MKKSFLLIILFYLYSAEAFSQTYTVKYIDSKILIDGFENEKIWSEANISSDYWQWKPVDSIRAINQTKFKALYDEQNLYFLVKSYKKGNNYTVYSLKRDFETASADYIQLIFDTFNDATNAFQFQTNHLGLKGDLLVSNGNRDPGKDRNKSWDAEWYVETQILEDYILYEIKIPLNQLYYISNSEKWRFNMYRSCLLYTSDAADD